MIRNTYYHFDVEGESGRKMRETPLFSAVADAGAFSGTDAGTAISPAAGLRNDKNAVPPDGGAEIMLGLDLRKA